MGQTAENNTSGVIAYMCMMGVRLHRGTLKDIDALENDELIYWLMDRGINPPDKAVKSDLIKYLIAGKGPREKKKSTKEVKEDV